MGTLLPALKYAAFRQANRLYGAAYPCYRPLYFLYKRVSDRELIARCRHHIEPGMTVLDIGANIGFYTRLFSGLVGERGRVFSFEPDVANFARLAAETRGLSNVTITRAAVGAENGTVRLFSSPDMNVDHRTYDSGDGRPSSEVDCIALDHMAERIGPVDFVKIDIQGYDCFALRGMKRLLGMSERVCIVGEFYPHGLRTAGVEPRAYLDLLAELGFSVTVLGAAEEEYLARADDERWYTDFIAVKGRGR